MVQLPTLKNSLTRNFVEGERVWVSRGCIRKPAREQIYTLIVVVVTYHMWDKIAYWITHAHSNKGM